MMKLEISKSLLLTPLRKLINIVSPFSPSENAVNGRGGGVGISNGMALITSTIPTSGIQKFSEPPASFQGLRITFQLPLASNRSDYTSQNKILSSNIFTNFLLCVTIILKNQFSSVKFFHCLQIPSFAIEISSNINYKAVILDLCLFHCSFHHHLHQKFVQPFLFLRAQVL